MSKQENLLEAKKQKVLEAEQAKSEAKQNLKAISDQKDTDENQEKAEALKDELKTLEKDVTKAKKD